jgi:hypothetical protein
MSVAFRTALLQALCLPTDEPDPDEHVYERATVVDLSTLDELIGAARAKGIAGKYDATRAWAAQSQANCEVAVHKLRTIIDSSGVGDGEAFTSEANLPVGASPPLPAGSGEGGSPAATVPHPSPAAPPAPEPARPLVHPADAVMPRARRPRGHVESVAVVGDLD